MAAIHKSMLRSSISPENLRKSSPGPQPKDLADESALVEKDTEIRAANGIDEEHCDESQSNNNNNNSKSPKEEPSPPKRNPGRPAKTDRRVSQVTRARVSTTPGRRRSRGVSVESRTSNASSGSSSHGRYIVGQEVLARWNDGLFYLGQVTKVGHTKCYIKFEDGSEYWALFKDIQKGEKDGEIECCLCSEARSESPDEIVLCDNCGVGFHQKCHKPEIASDVLKPDVPWQCRQCIFACSVRKGGALKTGPEAEALQAMKLTLPYDLNSITWDSTHKSNKEEMYCYCGGPGDWFMKMLQCCRCRQWFHEACTQCLEKPLCYGDRFYIFVCSVCNSGPEYIKRLQMKWVDLAQLALFNLTVVNNKKYYDFDTSFIPWVEQVWDRLQLDMAETKEERKKFLLEALESTKSRFMSGKEIKKRITLWGLRVRLPPQAPTIILPEEGQITDEVMNNLQMKGRRTKTFVPLESQSPVPMRYGSKRLRRNLDDSLENTDSKRLRTDDGEAASSNQSYSGYSGNSALYSLNATADSTDDESTSQTMLDFFIPRPMSFSGHNHPFKLHIEQSEELEYKKLKRKLLNSYQNDDTETEATSETIDDESDQFENVSYQSLEMSPLVDSSSSGSRGKTSDLGPPKLLPMVHLKKRRGRKKRAEVLVEKAQKARQQYLKSIAQNGKRCGPGQKGIGEFGDSAIMSTLTSNIKSYFGANSQLDKGEGFRVLGKRLMPDGKLQYLIEWEGLISC